jgi:hypothetical protein
MSTNRAPVESGLSDIRTEWVAETTPGEFPGDPEWNAYAPEISEFSYSTGGNKENRDALGSLDPVDHDRATETATATVSYRQARFPVDSSGTVVDPIAYPITVPAGQDYPSHTIVERREITAGGALGAGFREYAVITGARPVGAAFDGDPSSTEPLPQELTYEAERGRTHIIHQPDSEQTLVVKSTDDTDTNDVIIESEGASTEETVTLPGGSTNTVETTESFGDIDAFEVVGEHAGDIQVGTDDGTGAIDTELLEKPLTGTNTDGVDSIAGVPALGSGSHASDITAEAPQFLGTDATWTGPSLADRVHTLNLSVEREVSREPRQTTRRAAIDVGSRSVEISADLAGPFETAERISEHHRDKSGDLVWTFNTGDTITTHNTEIAEAPDHTRSAGDTNYIPSVSFEPTGDPAIEINSA